MATNIYLVNYQNSVTLSFADEMEVEAMLASQKTNPFLKAEQRIEYLLLGSTAESISIEWDKIDTFSVSKLASCNDIDFQFLRNLDLETLSIQNCEFLSNKTLPETIKSKKLVVGFSVESNFNLTPFSEIETIELLSWTDKTRFEGVSNAKNFTVWGFNTKKKPVISFSSSFPSLESVTINKSNSIDLSGISDLSSLKRFSISYASRLNGLEGLGELGRLEKVSFEKCGKIFDFTFLSNLKGLVEIKVLDCKEISSVKFIQTLPCLKKFTLLKTKVLDDSLPLLDLIES